MQEYDATDLLATYVGPTPQILIDQVKVTAWQCQALLIDCLLIFDANSLNTQQMRCTCVTVM
jgi:hypothetical protein